MNTISKWALAFAIALVSVVVTTQPARAQTFETLYSFCAQTNCTDGYEPHGRLIQATDGNLYGTTIAGGATTDSSGASFGTVFKITPGGALTTLYSFCFQSNCTDGDGPLAGLIQATDGNFYGTTEVGGTNAWGTAFKLTPSGTLTTLHSFCSQGTYPNCTDGQIPGAALIQATDGSLYGATEFGGPNGNSGTVFKVTPTGALTTLYSFCSQTNCADGSTPTGPLIQASDGNFYGTTGNLGVNGNYGTVFRITASGTLATLHSFNGADGQHPEAGLIQATDGNLYGTTQQGGANGAGTVFQITTSGSLTTLYSFCSQTNCADGEYPNGLIQASDGNFYGTAQAGGAGYGTVFKVAPAGTLTTLHTFGGADGDAPLAGLTEAANRQLYGITDAGGANDRGTIYTLTLPLTLSCPATIAQVGASYNSALTAAGGIAPYSFSNTGNLPSGLTLNASTGAVTGTATTAGVFNFTAKLVDSSGSAAGSITAICTITVSPAPQQLSVTPTSVNFDSVPRYRLLEKTVTLKNTGTGAVSLGRISLTPRSNDFYALSLCPFLLAVGESCPIFVVFFAENLGALSATLNIPSNAPGSPQTLPISANVTKMAH